MKNKIGIIAGRGSLPVIAAKNAAEEGYEVFSVCFENFTSKEIEKYSISKYFRLGNFSKPIEFLKENNVKDVILLGTIDHINIFKDVMTDLRGARFLLTLKNKTPLGILKAIGDELQKDGINVIDSTLFLKNLMAEEGVLIGKLKENDEREIRYGFNIAKKIADMDIGLSIALKDYCVIAVEAVEGTDECIKRAGDLLKGEKFILVKVSRTNQDFRFDLPVVGIKTLETGYKYGVRIIVLEAERTIIVDKNDFIKKAKEFKITVVGIK